MTEFDPTDKWRFETQEDAIDFAERFSGKSTMVIKLEDPKYSDKPFMVVLQEWITALNTIK